MSIPPISQQESVAVQNDAQWFAMRATYHREMAVRDLLDQANIECYLPTTQKLKVNNGRMIRVEAPLVSSLIFVRCDKEKLQHFKTKIPHLQYMTMQQGTRNVPIVVPPKQMDDFVAITQQDNSRLMFFKPGELDVKQGVRVRLHGGTFDGVEGLLMKVAGKRNKRVVIEVSGVVAVALECKDVQFVEVL